MPKKNTMEFHQVIHSFDFPLSATELVHRLTRIADRPSSRR